MNWEQDDLVQLLRDNPDLAKKNPGLLPGSKLAPANSAILLKKLGRSMKVEIPMLPPKQTRLLPQNAKVIPNITDYPLPKVAKSRRIAQVNFRREPISAQVLLSNNRFYRKEDYHAYMDALRWLIKEQLGGVWDTHRYSFGIRVRFFLGNRRKIDIDNLLKPVMDAGTRLVWADDSQVAEVYAVMLKDERDPRIEILIYSIEDFVDYHGYCLCCGKELTAKGLTRKYCSSKCRDTAQRKGIEITCEACGKVFWSGRLRGDRKGGRRFCSRVCYYVWIKAHGDKMVERINKEAVPMTVLEFKEDR